MTVHIMNKMTMHIVNWMILFTHPQKLMQMAARLFVITSLENPEEFGSRQGGGVRHSRRLA